MDDGRKERRAALPFDRDGVIGCSGGSTIVSICKLLCGQQAVGAAVSVVANHELSLHYNQRLLRGFITCSGKICEECESIFKRAVNTFRRWFQC